MEHFYRLVTPLPPRGLPGGFPAGPVVYTGGAGGRQSDEPQGPLGKARCTALPCIRTRMRGVGAPSASIPLRARP